jgi:hypothetical protein
VVNSAPTRYIVVGLPHSFATILLLTNYPSIPPSLCKRIHYPDDEDFEGFTGNEGASTAQNVHLTPPRYYEPKVG